MNIDNPDTLQTQALVTPEEHLGALRRLAMWADQLDFAYAWGRGHESEDHVRILASHPRIRGVLGSSFGSTDPETVRALARGRDNVRVLTRPGLGKEPAVFHPKVLLGRSGDRFAAIVGSCNFTTAAFRTNDEVSILLAGPASSTTAGRLLGEIERAWRAATPVDDKVLAWLQSVWRPGFAGSILPDAPPADATVFTHVHLNASGYRTGRKKEFAVLAGSEATVQLGNVYPNTADARKRLIDARVLVEEGGVYRFRHTVAFNSPSQAAGAVYGSRVNGLTHWEHGGKPLGDFPV